MHDREQHVDAQTSQIKRDNSNVWKLNSFLSEKIKAGKRNVIVEPTLIFQRICLSIESKGDVKKYLKYELPTFPMPLFKNGLMRKTQKLEFYKNFTPSASEPAIENLIYFVYGVYLLHRVIWSQCETLDNVQHKYVSFVQGHCAP